MASLAAAARPRTSLGCLFPAAEVAALRAWMSAGGGTGPALVTAGPGSGLTTLLTLLVREVGLEAVWIGCATPRVKQLLQHAGASPVSVTLRRKIIIVDEFDAFGSGDSSALSDALAFAKASPPLPVLFASHSSRSQKSQEYAKGWPRFEFGKPGGAVMRTYLRSVCDRHGVDATDDIVAKVVARVRGDLRAGLMTLDAMRIGGSMKGDADVCRHAKDESDDALDIVEGLLRDNRGRDLADCLKAYHMEPSVVPMGLFENYLAGLRGGGADIAAAALAAESWAHADLLDRYIYRHQAWDVAELYAVAAVAAPVMHMRRERASKPSPTFGVTKFGSVWSRVYNMHAKMKHVRDIAHARAEAGLAALDTADLGLVRRCLRGSLDGCLDDASVSAACAALAPAQVLQLVRLQPGAVSWYRQAHQTRVKRILGAGAGGRGRR